MMQGNKPANPFNGDSRVACSPPHGVSGSEGGKAIYRLSALEYYVARSRQRHEANLKLPASCLIASAAMLMALSMLVLAAFGRVEVSTPAILAYAPQEHASGSGRLPSTLLLPANAAIGLDLRAGSRLNCRINGKEEHVVIADSVKVIDPEAVSRELGIDIARMQRLGGRVLVIGLSTPIEASDVGSSLVIIRSVRLVDLLHWGVRVRH